MAWDDEIVTIVRNMLGDTATTPKYTDDRLAEAILVAAQSLNVLAMQSSMPFSNVYSPNISNGTLKPDPTAQATRDDTFINLVALRTTCLLIRGENRVASAQSIGIRDGTSSLDLRRDPKLVEVNLKMFCDAFEDAWYHYRLNGGVVGEAIVGPYKIGFMSDVDPRERWYFGGW